MNMLAVGLLGFVVPVVTSAAPPSWIQAQVARALSPLMTPASRVGLAEAEALGEFLVPMVTATAEQPAPDCWAEFVVSVPTNGAYYLWARVRFPAGADESFRIAPTNAAADTREVILGAGTDARYWHWVNSGRIELPAGPWTFRIHPHRAAASTFGPLRWRQAEQRPIRRSARSANHRYMPLIVRRRIR